MGDLQTYGYVDILRYLQQKMSPQEMHDFEKALMNDAFLADALEGYLASDQPKSELHLDAIEKAFTQQDQKAKVVYFSTAKTEWWKIAVVFVIIISAVAVTISVYNNPGKTPGKPELAAAKANVAPPRKDNLPSVSEPSARTYSKAESTKQAKKIGSAESNSNIAVTKRRRNFFNKTAQEKLQDKSDLAGNTTAHPDTNIFSTNVMARITEGTQSEVRNSLADKPFAMKRMTKEEGQKKMAAKSNTADIPIMKKADSNVMNNKLVPFERQHAVNAKIAPPQKTDSVKEPELTLAEEVISTILKKKNSVPIIIRDSTIAAEPLDGWDRFQQYISRHLDSLRMSEGGAEFEDIEIEFSLDPQGQPTDVKVVRANNQSMATKIIQLLSTGPRWKNKLAGKRTRITIQF
jgi:hypothetical protein